MQNRYKLIFIFAALTLANFVKGQTTFLCSGEQVNLQAAENYWGLPKWEFSSDGEIWSLVSEQPAHSFTLNPSNSGFYRLSYTDEACISSFVSETKEIRAQVDSFAIRSFFSDNAIPNDADPVFWYESPDSLSQIMYFLNGSAVATTNELLQQIVNPGANFEIYATAINQQGCTVFTPVYACTVYDSAQTGNGDLQLPLTALNDGILISSSIDSINVNTNGPFTIDYSYSMGFDVVFASRPSQPVNQQLLGMTVIYDEQANFVVSSENSALAMVLTLPDVTNTARVYPNQVTSYIQQSALFPSVIAAIDAQLNAAGYINYEDANLWQFVRAVGEDVVAGLFPTLFDACLAPDAPSIEIFPNHLSFKNCGINTAYFARLYNHDNIPVSNPILFLGDGQEIFTNRAFNFIGNLLLTNPSTASLFTSFIARTNGEITAADLTSVVLFDELTVRLTNGNGFNIKPEDGAAEAYNDFSFIVSLSSAILALPQVTKRFSEALQCGITTGQLIIDYYNLTVKPSLPNSISEAAQLLVTFRDYYTTFILGCDPAEANTLTSNFFSATSFMIEAGWMAQFLYDWNTKQPKAKYICTKAGNRWMGKLKVVSNANLPFYGVPGSLAYNAALPTNEKPFFKLLETDVYATIDNGDWLWENDYLPLNNLEGFTCFGTPGYDTENIAINDVPIEVGIPVFTGVAFSNNQNDLKWRFAKNAATPSEADLYIGFKFNDVQFPNYIEGIQNGGLAYVGTIETPQLLINDGSNNQIGAANSFLPSNCNVTLVGASGRPARDCDVEFEVIQGGGTLKKYTPWIDDGESPMKVINTGFDYGPLFSSLNGLAGVKWRLGQSGDQKLKVSYKPNGVELTSVQLDATFAPLSVTYSGFIPTGQTVWNTPSTSLHAVGGVPPYQYDFFENCDSWSTDSVIQYPGDGIVTDGCGNENFRLGGYYLMRVRDAVGSIATVLVLVNRERAIVTTTNTICDLHTGSPQAPVSYIYQAQVNFLSPNACFNLQGSQNIWVHVVGSNIPGLYGAGGISGSGGTNNDWNDIVNGIDTTDNSYGAAVLTIPNYYDYSCINTFNTYIYFWAFNTALSCTGASCSYRVQLDCPNATNAASPYRWIWSNVITHTW